MSSIKKIDLIDEKSDLVKEVLERTPPIMIRWGTSFFMLSVLCLLALSYIVKYPDIIAAEVVVTTEPPPVSIVAKSTGEIVSLDVQEKDTVTEGQTLAIIKNGTDPNDVNKLEEFLASVNVAQDFLEDEEILFERLQNEFVLGEIQPSFSEFRLLLNDYITFKNLDPIAAEIALLRRQIKEYDSLLLKQKKQQNTVAEELVLSNKDLKRNKMLFSNGAISEVSYEEKQKEFLRLKRTFQTIEADVSDSKIRFFELKTRSNNLRLLNHEKYNSTINKLIESYNKLITNISLWEEKYILRAPVSGIVAFSKFQHQYKYLKTGEEVFTILPIDKNSMIGQTMIPTYNAGKVKVGQKAIVKFDNYPYQEYGTITAKVKSISSVPESNAYAVELQVPDQLRTSYQKVLNFKPEMQGKVEIVTEDLRLVERIFYNFRALFTNDQSKPR